MNARFHGLGRLLLRWRLPIGILLAIVTLLAAWQTTRVRLVTRLEDYFPTAHPNARLYREFWDYSAAQSITFMLRVRHGDIFNEATLKKLAALHWAAEKFYQVNHSGVFSLASYRIVEVKAVPGGIDFLPYMWPYVPEDKAGIDQLRKRVSAHKDELRHFISADYSSAAIEVNFINDPEGHGYGELLSRVRSVVNRFQDRDHAIFVAGEPITRGYGYFYLPTLTALAAGSAALVMILLWLCLGQFSGWWVPGMCAGAAALWALGFAGLRSYHFDPLLLFLPLLLVARSISQGVQWQRRFQHYAAYLDLSDACAATAGWMLPVGLLCTLADVCGLLVISRSGVPMLEQVGAVGAVWMAASGLLVLVLQPIVMSYLPARQRAMSRGGRLAAELNRQLLRADAFGGTRGPVLAAVAAAVLVAGIACMIGVRVGSDRVGTPLYAADTRVNRDLQTINQTFALDEGWVVIDTPTPAHGSAIWSMMDYDVLKLQNDLREYLLPSPMVSDVATLADLGIKPFNQVLHSGHPKFFGFPNDPHQSAASMGIFLITRGAPGELEQFIKRNHACVRILLKDHTAATLAAIEHQLADFERSHLNNRPGLAGIHIRFLGGVGGLYAAADQTLFGLDLRVTLLALLALLVLSVLFLRSALAGLLAVVTTLGAIGAGYICLQGLHSGLTIDTIAVVLLAIGLTMDYPLYMLDRIGQERGSGVPAATARLLAATETGGAILLAMGIMVCALVPWCFSPVLFHRQMGAMVAMVLIVGALGAVFVLPALQMRLRPRAARPGTQAELERSSQELSGPAQVITR